MSTLLVIGNGFDLALGYDTSYSHFANTVLGSVKHGFWPFNSPDNSQFQSETLHQHFYNYFISQKNDDGSVRWLDLETELYNYAKSKIGTSISQELVNKDFSDFQILVKSLHTYLIRHQELKYHYVPPKGEDACVIELLKALSKDKTFKKAYTFNYTNLEEYLIKYGEFEDKNIPHISYVHGRLQSSSIKDPHIVLGINTDISLPNEYSFLQKINNPYADAEDLAKDLMEADEIIFYGLSMGIVDFEYFLTFFRNIVNAPFSLPKKHITIFTRGANNVSSIIRHISEMGVSPRELKEHAHFNIIDTADIVNTNNENGSPFNKLISRLTS